MKARTGVDTTLAPRAVLLALTLLLAAAGPADAHHWRVARVLPWFGPGEYGNRTACGQRMTRKLIGVASRTLPCGTIVELRYDGHHRFVPVVDRGPWPDRSQYASMPFDATARLAIHLAGGHTHPYTMHDVEYRVR